MKILQTLSMQTLATMKAEEFADFALQGKASANESKARLAKAYQRAISELQIALEKQPDLPQIKQALAHMEQLRDETIAPGVRLGIEALQLQKKLLSSWLSDAERKTISHKIVQLFEKASSYQEMFDLRETIDSGCVGASRLHSLVYNDVDTESCHAILRLINQNVKGAHAQNAGQIQFSYMIYSDIDDTIKGSLNDQNTHISGFYPSSLEFYKQLGSARPKRPEGRPDLAKITPDRVHLTFLSARPVSAQKIWNSDLKGKLPNNTKFFALYGSSSAFLTAAVYYTIVKWISAVADLLPEGSFKQKIKDFCQAKESKTFISFALDKRRNIDRDLLLRPEMRAVFVGDCGEGDLIFLLMKNCKVPPLITDSKIPEEYVGDKKWDGSFDEPGNPSHKPLYLGFAHALSSTTDYGTRPDPKYAKEFEKGLQAHIFDNFVDNALYCLNAQILDRDACDKVVENARAWLSQQKIAPLKKGVQLAELPPESRYRQKLLQSIEAYDAALKGPYRPKRTFYTL